MPQRQAGFPLSYSQQIQDFQGPIWSPQMFKYKEKTAFTLQLQYLDAMHMECRK